MDTWLTQKASTEAILDSVRGSSKPEDVGVKVLHLLLDTVAEFPASHNAIITLLPAIRGIPLTPNPVYCNLASIHQEHFQAIAEHRFLWKPEDKQAPSTPADRWVNHNVFTVKLATSGFDDEYFTYGFFCLRDTLERGRKQRVHEIRNTLYTCSSEISAIDVDEVINYDLTAAAMWVIIGASHVYRLGNTIYSEDWEHALSVETDFWNGKREPGLSWGRWRLWCDRFKHFAEEPYVKDEVGVLCKEAVAAIGKAMFPKVD